MSTIINQICKSFSQSGVKVCILKNTNSTIAKKEKREILLLMKIAPGYERQDIFGLT